MHLDGFELVDIAITRAGRFVAFDVVLALAALVAVVSHALPIGNTRTLSATGTLFKSTPESHVNDLEAVWCIFRERQVVEGGVIHDFGGSRSQFGAFGCCGGRCDWLQSGEDGDSPGCRVHLYGGGLRVGVFETLI